MGKLFKLYLIFLTFVFSILCHAQEEEFVVAIPIHIDDSPFYKREPYGLIWRSENTVEFDKIFGGPIRVGIHIIDDEFFPSFTPTLADNSLDMSRAKGWNALTDFSEENYVTNKEDGTLWSTLEKNGPSLEIGKFLKSRKVYFCTGPYRNVCSLRLEGKLVRIAPPIDWSKVKVSDIEEIKANECTDNELKEMLNSIEKKQFELNLKLSIILIPGHNTSCNEIKAELESTQQIYNAIGINVEFYSFTKTNHLNFDIIFIDKMPKVYENQPLNISGFADREHEAVLLSQPDFGRRNRFVLSHEIGHMLGLEHVQDDQNIMIDGQIGGGVLEKSTSLTNEQIQIVKENLSELNN